MFQEEPLAKELSARLVAAGMDARASGGGVHWRVDVGSAGARSLRIHCFWYPASSGALQLGVNPSNERSRLGRLSTPYTGPEFLVCLSEGATEVAAGRARHDDDVILCAKRWLEYASLEEVERIAPFVNERLRMIRAVAERLDPRLRRDISGDPSYELWVYGDNRSCELVAYPDTATITCKFLLGQAQVAFASQIEEPQTAAATWLLGNAPLRRLLATVSGVELERHAEVLESDPARWHWVHVRDRIADPNDVLAPSRELIEALARSPIASTFFSFSSLSRFCFSASSHFPWVNEGLPIVAPADNGVFVVCCGTEEGKRCSISDAVALIERTLATYPVKPFFGSAPHHELPLLSECLASRGSELRPQVIQQQGWFRLIVGDSAKRHCVVSGAYVEFRDGKTRVSGNWKTLDETVRAIQRFLELGTTIDDVVTHDR